MTATQMVGFLVERFPNKSIEEIKRITFYQLHRVYLCERDDKGVPLLPGRKKGLSAPTYRETFWNTWKDRGETEKQIEKRWEDYVLTNYVKRDTDARSRNGHR
jgi:hypothetical protein